jgi:outer membrane protein assembly factor BamE (lipoprotein component of BamABCDE complex)
MNKFTIAGLSLLVAPALSGCVNSHDIADEKGAVFDVTAAENTVKIGESTLEDVRGKLGTPAMIVRAKSDNDVVAGFTYTDDLGNMAAQLGKHLITLGFGAKHWPYIQKNIYIKFNEDGTAKEVKSNGYSYQSAKRITWWNEFEHELTDDELRDTSKHDIDYIERIYLEGVAKKKNTTVDKLTSEDHDFETKFCNIACFVDRGLKKAFGEYNIFVKGNAIADFDPSEKDSDHIDPTLFK